MTKVAKKRGWARVALGDVAQLNRERSSNPAQNGFERYVGLEHLDPGDLRVRRWGSTADGTTFTNVFHPGQVLFGKRRAYQHKVAVADFHGVCSGDIYVLEPKDRQLLPELLPFICQTDSFFDHAVGTSAGSLSPRTNWQSLAKYEFDLPPLEEQREIADALIAVHACTETCQSALGSLETLIGCLARELFARASRDSALASITEIGEVTMGRQKAPKYSRGLCPRPFLSVANVGALELLLDQVEVMDFTERELQKYRLEDGDIILTEGDLVSSSNVGRPAMFRGEILDCCFQNTLIRFRAGPRVDPFFALLMMEGARRSGVFAQAAKTTTVTHLGLGRFAQIPIPVPARADQEPAGHQLSFLLDSRANLRTRFQQVLKVKSAASGTWLS